MYTMRLVLRSKRASTISRANVEAMRVSNEVITKPN
jgi:hypothetical protein